MHRQPVMFGIASLTALIAVWCAAADYPGGLKDLAKARIEIARKQIQAIEDARLKPPAPGQMSLTGEISALAVWSRRLMDAERDSGESPEEDAAAIRAHIGRLEKWLEPMKGALQAGRVSPADLGPLEHEIVEAKTLLIQQRPAAPAAAAAGRAFSVIDHGARGDGKTLCTQAIQKAIDACAAAGGGTVSLPPGTYRSGTVFLKSRVTLHLEAGATLLGSTDLADYPPVVPKIPSRTNLYIHRSLIYAEDQHEIGIAGQGTIDGSGAAFQKDRKDIRKRPYNVRIVNCRDVRVEDVHMRDSGCWNQHYLACQRVLLRGLRVYNHTAYNGDGLDIDASSDVVVTQCFIDSDDDAVCLKSTFDRPCENVLISDCVISSHCNAIKAGTDSTGGFVNVTITNCSILSPRTSKPIYGRQRGSGGLALEIVDGGRMERITVSNLSIDGVEVPIFVRLGSRGYGWLPEGAKREKGPATGTIRDVSLANIVATRAGKTGCSLTGLPGHPLQNITLANVTIRTEGGGEQAWVSAVVPEHAEKYPEGTMFGNLPAYGLYCRHVQGLTLSDVRLHASQPDQRHALVLDDVEDADASGLKLSPAAGAAALVRAVQTRNLLLRGSAPQAPGAAFLKIEGPASSGIGLVGNDLARVARVAELGPGVPPDALRQAENLVRKP